MQHVSDNVKETDPKFVNCAVMFLYLFPYFSHFLVDCLEMQIKFILFKSVICQYALRYESHCYLMFFT